MQHARNRGTRSLRLADDIRKQTKSDGTRALRDMRPITAENVIGFDALWESMVKSSEGVKWKSSVASFVLNGAANISELSRDLHEGTYKPRKNTHFVITSPKRRNVVAQAFRDRVYHRSLVDNLVYPCLEHLWIYDNAACQKGKGTDFARERFKLHLQKAYARWGTDVWILSVDVKGYYDSIPHDQAEQMLRDSLPEWGARMVIDALRHHYPGTRGYNPGSDIVQMIGISYLSGVDHYVQDGMRIHGYSRYMDDLRIVHGSREVLEACLDGIKERMEKLGLEIHPRKTHIKRASVPNAYLGFDYRMLPSGRVVMTIKPESIKRMRRRIGRLAMLEANGERPHGITMAAYIGWRVHAAHGDSEHELRTCDEWYMEQILRRLSDD